MEPSDKAINEYLSFEPASFDFFDRIEMRQHEIWEDIYSSRYSFSVEIWLSQYSSEEPHPQLRLYFEEVQNLCLQGLGSPCTLNLNIRSLRQDQWDYLRYAVTDEEGKLSFYSRVFKADLVEGHGKQN